MDNSPSTGPTHPALENMRRKIRLSRNVATIVLGIMGLMFAGTALVTVPNEVRWIVLGSLAVTMVFVVLVMRFALGKQGEVIDSAADIIASAKPRPMLMEWTRLWDTKGLLVKLREQGATESSPLWGLASVRTMKKMVRKPKGLVPVQMYLDPYSSQGDLVLTDTLEQAFWGMRVSRESYAASWKSMRLFFAGFAIFGFLFGAAFYLVSQAALPPLKEDLALAGESYGWPHAPGRILRSEVQETRIKKGKSSVQGFKAVLAYEYTVNRQEYRYDMIHFGYKPVRNRAGAQALVDEYPVGREVEVLFYPKDPARAVLIPGNEDVCRDSLNKQYLIMYMGMGAGLLFILGAVVLYASMNTQRKKLFGDDGLV